MTRDERHLALLRAHRAGDRRALGELCEQLVPFVRWLSARHRDVRESREDIEGAAWVGVMEAVERYDEAAGSAFVNYAGLWARAMIKGLMTRGLTTRGAKRVYWNEARARAVGLSSADAAAVLGVTQQDVDAARAYRRPAAVFEDEHGGEGEVDVVSALDGARAAAAVEGLPDDERYVLRELLMKHETSTLRDVAATLGVSRTTVMNMRERALRKLKEVLR